MVNQDRGPRKLVHHMGGLSSDLACSDLQSRSDNGYVCYDMLSARFDIPPTVTVYRVLVHVPLVTFVPVIHTVLVLCGPAIGPHIFTRS